MKRLALILLLLSSAASAQQMRAPEHPGPPPQEATAFDQALSNKLLMEINASIACETKNIATAKQLADAQAQVKALKDKYEPAKTN